MRRVLNIGAIVFAGLFHSIAYADFALGFAPYQRLIATQRFLEPFDAVPIELGFLEFERRTSVSNVACDTMLGPERARVTLKGSSSSISPYNYLREALRSELAEAGMAPTGEFRDVRWRFIVHAILPQRENHTPYWLIDVTIHSSTGARFRSSGKYKFPQQSRPATYSYSTLSGCEYYSVHFPIAVQEWILATVRNPKFSSLVR